MEIVFESNGYHYLKVFASGWDNNVTNLFLVCSSSKPRHPAGPYGCRSLAVRVRRHGGQIPRPRSGMEGGHSQKEEVVSAAGGRESERGWFKTDFTLLRVREHHWHRGKF